MMRKIDIQNGFSKQTIDRCIFYALKILNEFTRRNKRPIRLNEVCNLLGVSKGTRIKYIGLLERLNLIEWVSIPNDQVDRNVQSRKFVDGFQFTSQFFHELAMLSADNKSGVNGGSLRFRIDNVENLMKYVLREIYHLKNPII